MTYVELEHTADVKIRVIAPTLANLFEEAARALMEVMYHTIHPGSITCPISITSDDQISLMHDFLSEILYISEVEEIVISSADLIVGEKHLKGVFRGEKFDPKKHRGGMEVKGISYSGLLIRWEDDHFILEVIFDV
ncbi:MAG TPA: archease [Methanoregulaceae archaeon]|nr:archease [Methanoregulaceae archaeon]